MASLFPLVRAVFVRLRTSAGSLGHGHRESSKRSDTYTLFVLERARQGSAVAARLGSEVRKRQSRI